MEEWIKENEDMGGPQGILETMSFLINEARMAGMRAQNAGQNFEQLRAIAFKFVAENKLEEEWDAHVKEQETDAVQEQQTEEVSVQEEAESSEEVIEAQEEEE